MFLAAPGDAIWRLLETPRTLPELADELQRQFAGDLPPSSATSKRFVAELAVAGLVER